MLLDFREIPEARKPNDALAAPAHWDRRDADFVTPLFAVPVDRLREAMVRIAAEEPRTHLVHLDKEASQAQFEQSSKIFKFKDIITVAFEPAEGGSTLAIYSRARLGYYDFGVNRRRVRRWLAALEAQLQPAERSET